MLSDETGRFSRLAIVPRITLRSLRPPADYATLAALRTDCAVTDGRDALTIVEPLPTVEDLLRQHPPHSEAAHDLTIAEVIGRPIGYASLTSEERPEGLWLTWVHAWVLAEWRRERVGALLLEWGEERARQVGPHHAPQATRYACGALAAEADEAWNATLTAAGYRVDSVLLELACTLRAPWVLTPLPTGVALRSLEDAQVRTLWEAVRAAYHTGTEPPVDATHDEAAYQTFSTDPYRAPALCQLAWADDALVGQVLCDVVPIREGVRIELTEASVAPAWRRRGIARALLTRALTELYKCGYASVRLVAREDNAHGAVGLYTGLGFRVVGRYLRYRKDL